MALCGNFLTGSTAFAPRAMFTFFRVLTVASELVSMRLCGSLRVKESTRNEQAVALTAEQLVSTKVKGEDVIGGFYFFFSEKKNELEVIFCTNYLAFDGNSWEAYQAK